MGTSLMAASLFMQSCSDDDPIDYSGHSAESNALEAGLVPLGEPLHVDGKYLKGPDGQIVNLHGFAQTYSPWFNRVDGKETWSNYDVAGCLRVNQEKIHKIMKNGWAMDFVRLHMDPHWTVVNKHDQGGEATAHLYFSQANFKKYLDEVFVPMAKYMQNQGLRVVMRPPGVCPEVIELDDKYHNYLKTVWKIVATHPDLVNNPNIMFELANEPVKFRASDGKEGASGGLINKELSQFFQEIVDVIRQEGCNNILWVPGTSWQQNYEAFKEYPIQGKNIGYAIHCYPGWYGSDCYQKTGEIAPDMWRGSEGGYTGFKKQFTAAIMNTVGNKAPIIVTEMDWASQKYQGRTWGSSITGVAGGKGFGANFKKIMDECGNVSYLTFAWDHDMASYDPNHKADDSDFIYDPESCIVPIYKWFKEYWDAATAASEK
ncbi:MAG: glycoside hydrolase family 5 protein [Bacteroidales bacterium]|nr:glycoside hydrolase family 5 protein [Bacteroidales bacterium]